MVLDLISKWLSVALGVACVVLMVLLFKSYADHSATKADWADARAAVEQAAKEESEKQREIELERQNVVDKQRSELDAAKNTLNQRAREVRDLLARIDALGADRDRLRDQNRRFAAGPAGGDSLGACQTRAGALADLLTEGEGLLGEGSRLATEAAEAHDVRAAEVIACVKSWPVGERLD